MLIGVPKEIKTHEYRVGLVPASVRELIHTGPRVVVQTGAGAGIGFDDADYKAVGATIAKTAADVFAKAEMIVKVKEPQPAECKMLRQGQLPLPHMHTAHRPRAGRPAPSAPAAPRPDERGCRPHVRPGRRPFPGEGERRLRRAPRRR